MFFVNKTASGLAVFFFLLKEIILIISRTLCITALQVSIRLLHTWSIWSTYWLFNNWHLKLHRKYSGLYLVSDNHAIGLYLKSRKNVSFKIYLMMPDIIFLLLLMRNIALLYLYYIKCIIFYSIRNELDYFPSMADHLHFSIFFLHYKFLIISHKLTYETLNYCRRDC